MKISNFKLLEVIGTSALNWKFKASVDVTTGRFFKKTENVEVYKNYAGSWYFTETGEFDGFQVDALARSFEAKQGRNLENADI